MKHVLMLVLTTVALATGCARDCTTLVQQRCKSAALSEADCRDLATRAAAAPAQTCEAVLQALETRGQAR